MLLIAPSQCRHSATFSFVFSKFLKRDYKVNNKLNLLPEMTSFFFPFVQFWLLNLEKWIQTQVLLKQKACLLHIIEITETDNFIEAKNVGFDIYHLLFFLSVLEINLYRLQLNSVCSFAMQLQQILFFQMYGASATEGKAFRS